MVILFDFVVGLDCGLCGSEFCSVFYIWVDVWTCVLTFDACLVVLLSGCC